MEPIERELRDAMRAEVDGTQSSDALDTILARTRPANRRGALGARRWFVVGGASLAAAATITAVVLLAEGTLSTSSRPKPPVSSTVTHQDVTVAVVLHRARRRPDQPLRRPAVPRAAHRPRHRQHRVRRRARAAHDATPGPGLQQPVDVPE